MEERGGKWSKVRRAKTRGETRSSNKEEGEKELSYFFFFFQNPFFLLCPREAAPRKEYSISFGGKRHFWGKGKGLGRISEAGKGRRSDHHSKPN